MEMVGLQHILLYRSQELVFDRQWPDFFLFFFSVELILAWTTCTVNKRTDPSLLMWGRLLQCFSCVDMWSPCCFFVFVLIKKKKKKQITEKSFSLLETGVKQLPNTSAPAALEATCRYTTFISNSRGENSNAASNFLAIVSSQRIRFLFNKSLLFPQSGKLMSHQEVVQVSHTVPAFGM